MILITGANGQLGSELRERLETFGQKYTGFASAEWNISDREMGQSLLEKYRPAVVINCAAYTAVDKAEEEVDKARAVNGEGPRILRELCAQCKVFLIHISTDFIFQAGANNPELRPWKTEDVMSPEGVYALTKAEGEEHILNYTAEGESKKSSLTGAAIVRTSWLYSKYGNNFPRTILRLAKDESRAELRIIEDQIGRPTWAGRLADFILAYIESERFLKLETPGAHSGQIFHFSNSGVASWYDFAVAMLEISRAEGLLNRELPVHAIPTKEYPTPAVRPHYSVMDLESARELMSEIPHWREDLALFVKELKKIEQKEEAK